MTRLQRWCAERQVTQAQLGAATGIAQALISKYVRGVWVPGLRNALLIEWATGGEVNCWSWADYKHTLKKGPVLRGGKRAA